jgi:hypothetical protein
MLTVLELCPGYERLDVDPFSAAWPMGAEWNGRNSGRQP